ncbi:MAG: acyl carrier protein [Verrucomicrobiota bacterium]|jgi:acyl carrier protein
MNSISPSQVKDFLKRHFQDQLRAKGIDPESIDDDFSLSAAGIVDSFGVIAMMMAIEEEFQMEIDIENLNPDDISIMGRFCKFVAESHAKSKEPS